MKIKSLTIPTTTQMRVVAQNGSPLLDENGDVAEVYIIGHTSDSKEYRKAARRIYGVDHTTSVKIGKKGQREQIIKNDPEAYEKSIRLLASVVTDVRGIDDFTFSEEAVLELFMNDGCAYMVEQWSDHLDDRANFTSPSGKPARVGSKSSPG